ncbi:MAG TPA: hypothetical protein VHA74_00220 [Candidatus Dojkabacteria bacterium]|nr:hypothetical protein [Candidatus Dojkabacteria bacterium]
MTNEVLDVNKLKEITGLNEDGLVLFAKYAVLPYVSDDIFFFNYETFSSLTGEDADDILDRLDSASLCETKDVVFGNGADNFRLIDYGVRQILVDLIPRDELVKYVNELYMFCSNALHDETNSQYPLDVVKRILTLGYLNILKANLTPEDQRFNSHVISYADSKLINKDARSKADLEIIAAPVLEFFSDILTTSPR